MKKVRFFLVFVLVFIVLGMFSACKDLDKPQYTVSFEADGGDPAPEDQVVIQGGKVTRPASMTKTGCVLVGWYKDAELTKEWNFATGIVNGNITLYAKWDVSYHTVDFVANGGSPEPSQLTMPYVSRLNSLPSITKTGYTFAGWYTEASFVNRVNWGWYYYVTQNITLYAKWLENFTVTFQANGGSPEPSQQTIAPGSKVTMPSTITRIGYTFAGWYKEAGFINAWDFANDTVTENITLYAKWLENFTVTFEANGGSLTQRQQIIPYGNKIVTPPTITRIDYSFVGWYKEATFIDAWNFASDTVTENITLYAKWESPTIIPGINFNAKIRWLDTNVQSGYAYIMEFDSDESIAPTSFSYNGKNNISITMKGVDTNRVFTLNANGSMFTVESGVTLILDNNLELKGRSSNSASLIRVNSGGNLLLNNGIKITGNERNMGGGVYVEGIFTMNGGEISGNKCTKYLSDDTVSSYGSYGGGVYVGSGTFIMNGGKISGNTSSTSYSATSSFSSCGGGVYVGSGTFTMSGGEISGNTSKSSYINSSYYNLSLGLYGGGVYVDSGTFTMNSGKISGNTSSATLTSPSTGTCSIASCGGGVYLGGGTFNMNGGIITDNICTNSSTLSGNKTSYGGGVYVGSGIINMSGGEISGNTSSISLSATSSFSTYGGGVYVGSGTINMSGGEISGNTSSTDGSLTSYGGGVYVNNGIFNMDSGKISDNTVSSLRVSLLRPR